MIRIAHLIDDINPGGVTRYLDFLSSHPSMAALAKHDVIRVSRDRPHTARVDADLVVSHLTLTWRGLPGLMMLRSQLPRTPLIHVEHSYCAAFVAANVQAPRRFRTLLRTSYALFDHVVAVSEAQSRWLANRDLVPIDRLSVIHPCVDLAPFRSMPDPAEHVTTIGAIGRLDRQKGFDILIQGFRTLTDPDLRLLVFGRGPQERELRALAMGDHRIRFEGFAPDPTAAMRACDVIAMPSRWEPYGIVALEAAAAGRTLLAAPVDGLRDHVARGALAVRDPSPRGWATAIEAVTLTEDRPPRRDVVATTVQDWRRLIQRFALMPGWQVRSA